MSIVSFSMVIGNEELVHECSPKYSSMETARMTKEKKTKVTRQACVPNQKFIVVATSRMIEIRRSSVDLRRRPSSAFQSFPIISNAGRTAFPMLAVVGNARDSML